LKQLRKRLTYANVMSSIAVFLVLGGAAVAAVQLPKNSVGKKQLKNNAVVTAKIKKNAVTSPKIKAGAIDGSKVKDGSLTGTDINLGTLGTVPSANQAKSADSANTANSAKTAGSANKTNQIANIFYRADDGSAKETVLNLGGLTITAECSGAVELVATTSAAHSLIDFYTPQDQDYESDIDFGPGEEFDADFGHDNGTTTDIYSLHYAQPGGINVTVELRDVDPGEGPVFPGSPQEADCYLGGFAISQ
jgi:hypothetical protein